MSEVLTSIQSRLCSPPCSAEYLKRRKTALWVTVALLSLSMVVLAIGLISATRTDNVPVAGYYPGITLMAAIIFISIGVITSFFCAVVDGIIAAEFIDRRPLLEGSCEFYVSGSGYAYDNYYTEATCRSSNSACKLRVRSNTCYCCYLYNCESPDYHAQYYEFTGVSSCWDVIHLHRLLWASVVLNLLGLFLGIITAAILGAYKDMLIIKLDKWTECVLEIWEVSCPFSVPGLSLVLSVDPGPQEI
uniref:Transmembrane protein 255B n=1 Tax=Myripristis murdjan TaxID=586833 RepID=A0A667Z3K0_9TELE